TNSTLGTSPSQTIRPFTVPHFFSSCASARRSVRRKPRLATAPRTTLRVAYLIGYSSVSCSVRLLLHLHLPQVGDVSLDGDVHAGSAFLAAQEADLLLPGEELPLPRRRQFNLEVAVRIGHREIGVGEDLHSRVHPLVEVAADRNGQV